jgi:predicted MPP superfamily phosphohydrolase
VTPARFLARTAGLGALAGAAVTAYAWQEARAYTLRSERLPVLPAGADPLRVLHLSDLHLTPGQSRKREWVRSLAALEPDLVVNTGDNLAHLEALPTVVDALGPLLDVPGVFVLGSNDYFAPTLRNPVRYLLPDDGSRNTHTAKLPWRAMIETFERAGWTDLSNTRATTQVRDLTFAWAGADDPHLEYDDLGAIAGPADASADVRIGVTHATTRSSLVTPTAARSAFRCTARWSPTATSSRPGPRACTAIPPTPRRVLRGRRGFTSRQVSAPRRTPRSASPAGPRRPC